MPIIADMQVSDELLTRYASLIYDVTGIRISPQKKALLSNRLRRRLRDTGIGSFEEYYRHLRRQRATDPEWAAFLQEITTHETYLFRDELHWNWLRETFLPSMASAALEGTRPKRLRIWSAACSTGDEAFTIAACIAATLPDFEQWQIKILGTDVGVDAVEQATAATYGARAMQVVPADVAQQWFTPGKTPQTWQAGPALRRMTEFRRHNLLEPLHEAPFDLIVLKNVLIYFDASSKRKVLDNLRKLMKPGAMLMAGAAEGIADLVKDLTRHYPWLYSKS